MKKIKLLLLGLFAGLFAFKINDTNKLVKAEEPEIELKFKDVSATDSTITSLKCVTPDFYPAEIKEHFKAPRGSVFILEGIEENLDAVCEYFENLPEFETTEEIKFFSVNLYRYVDDVKIYSDSLVDFASFYVSDVSTTIHDAFDELVLYETEEKTDEFTLSCDFEIEISPNIDGGRNYCFMFETEDFHTKPFKDEDIISAKLQYYHREDDSRFTVMPVLNASEVFNERYGFITEDPTGQFDDVDGPFFSLDCINKETNLIIGTGDDNVEIHSVPSGKMTIYFRLSFFSYGIQYFYYSNEVVIEDKINEPLLDGFNNRSTIGLNDNAQHYIEYRTILPLDNVREFTIESYYYDGSKRISNIHVFSTYEDTREYEEGAIVEHFSNLSKDFFRFNLNFSKCGEYKIYTDYSYETDDDNYYFDFGRLSKTIVVEEGQISQIKDPSEAFFAEIKIGDNKEEILKNNDFYNIVCVAGGKEIEIFPIVEKELIGENENTVFTINDKTVGNCISVSAENDGSKIVVNPFSEGNTNLVIATEITGFGIVEKTINFKVLKDISDISSIFVPDEFHYSNTNLNVSMVLNTDDIIKNLNIEWDITDSNGNAAQFIVNDNPLSITLINLTENDYTITVRLNGNKLCSQVVEVRDFNIDQFVQDNIWWMFLVALALMGGAITIKIFLTKNNTIVDQVSNACQMVEKIDLSSKDLNRDLFKLKLVLQKEIRYSSDLNIDGMNQYEKTIRYLNKSLIDLKNFDKKYEMSLEEKEMHLEQLKKDLNKALVVVTDIQVAKSIAKDNSFKANSNNYAKVEKEKKKK